MQSLEAKDINVNGVNYRLNVLSATAGSEILAKLLGMIGEPAGKLFGLGMEGELTPELASNVLGALGNAIARPGCVPMIKTLLGGLTKEEKPGFYVPVNYDVEFAAEYGKLSQLVKFGLEINYASFFIGNPVLRDLVALGVQQSM